MTEQYKRARHAACGQYLTDFPDVDLSEDDYEVFVEDHLWEGVENLPLSEVISQIDQLANSMISFHNMETSRA